MAGNLDRLFEDRRRRAEWGRWKGTAISATVHVLLAAAFTFLPGVMAEPKPKLKYVSVVVVTPTALGIPDPPPPPPPSPPVRTPPPPPPKTTPPPPPPEPDVPTLRTERKPEQPRRLRDIPPPPPPEPERLNRRKGSIFGHAQGSSATKKVLGVEDPNFTYGWYLDQLVTRVAGNWTRPLVGSGVQAIFSFRIQRDGSVTHLELAESSGLPEFDSAARRAIEASTPLAPLPDAYKESYLRINLVMK